MAALVSTKNLTRDADDCGQRHLYLKVIGPGACTFWRTGEGHRAILTRAASKFPPKIVLPVGVAVPAAGSAEMPAG